MFAFDFYRLCTFLLVEEQLHDFHLQKVKSLAEDIQITLEGAPHGEPPPTLFEYLPQDSLLFVDESHVTVPQLEGMYKGDRSRKQTLSDYGFRLPSCMDNRPLKFEEWEKMRPQTLFISATPE